MRLVPCVISAVLCSMALAAEPAAPPASKVFAAQLMMLEKEIVPLAEAMPEAKFSFAPTGGEFRGVRTFAKQVTHTAAVIYAVCAAILNEKNPTDMGAGENGPATIKSKDDAVKYLKDALAYGQKAMASLTSANLTGLVPSPFGNNKATRLSMASIAMWHSFDHYGQMVIYARMNGIVPPASRQ